MVCTVDFMKSWMCEKSSHNEKPFFFVLLLFKVQFHGCLILKLDRLVEMKARCESKFSWTCFTYKIFMYTVVGIYILRNLNLLVYMTMKLTLHLILFIFRY